MTMPTDTFTDMLPDLTRMSKSAFRHLHPEARDEAVQNALALTWKAVKALAEQDRADEPGIVKSCLWFAVRQTKTGRRAQGGTTCRDAFDGRRTGRAKFEGVDPNGFLALSTPVPDQVSFLVDVPALLATLTERQRRMATDLMGGMTTSEVADQHGVTPGAVSQFRTRFRTKYVEFMAG